MLFVVRFWYSFFGDISILTFFHLSLKIALTLRGKQSRLCSWHVTVVSMLFGTNSLYFDKHH